MNRSWLRQIGRTCLLMAMLAPCAGLNAQPVNSADGAASDNSTAATTSSHDAPLKLAKNDAAMPVPEQAAAGDGQARPNEAAGEAKPSNAERIARLNRAIESDRKRLAELVAERDATAERDRA